jgi:hypothetical protein
VSDTRLKELYARALARRSDVSAAPCPKPEELLALARREGSEEHRLAVLDHVMACSECRRELDLLRAIAKAGESSTGGSLAKTQWQRLAPLALAASILLAVGIGLGIRRTEAPDVSRGAAQALVLVAPLTEADPGRPVTFVWKAVPGALRYRLEVLDRNEAVAFSGETAETTLVMPEGRLQRGAEYRWWVRDITPGTQGASPLRRLRARRE